MSRLEKRRKKELHIATLHAQNKNQARIEAGFFERQNQPHLFDKKHSNLGVVC